MILCIGTTPAAQRVMVFKKLQIDAVNRATTTDDGSAGKSINVAKILHALGETPVATGFLGGDRGRWIRTDLASRGIILDFVEVAAHTRQCTTVIDEATGQITELVEESRPVSLSEYDQLKAIVRRHLPECQAVIMSGTLAAGGTPDFYGECTTLAHAAGKLTILDAAGLALTRALPARPGLVKPNRPELAATVGRELRDESEVITAMRDLIQRGAQRVIVTAGKEPALADDGTHVWRIRAPRIQAVNPIGSGDAFTAALTWRLVQGENLGDACRWAAAAGAANALTLMAGELDRTKVEELATQTQLETIQ